MRPTDGARTLLFVILDLAVTWPAFASLVVLGGQYATAAGGDERALLAAAAGYPSAVLSSPLGEIALEQREPLYVRRTMSVGGSL